MVISPLCHKTYIECILSTKININSCTGGHFSILVWCTLLSPSSDVRWSEAIWNAAGGQAHTGPQPQKLGIKLCEKSDVNNLFIHPTKSFCFLSHTDAKVLPSVLKSAKLGVRMCWIYSHVYPNCHACQAVVLLSLLILSYFYFKHSILLHCTLGSEILEKM